MSFILSQKYLDMQSKLMTVVLISVLSLTGCATMTPETARNSTENMFIWTVEKPIDQVFRKYKDHLENHHSGGDFLWSGGLRVKGYFYGETAELSTKMEGNIFTKTAYLHFDFNKNNNFTLVKTWYYNGFWKKHAESFRELFPSTAPASVK